MPTSFIAINNKVYQFDYGYQNTDFRREQLNEMTREIWDFSFESWYRSGYWEDSCVPYSLFDMGRLAAHVTASTFTFAIQSSTLRALQLGTVMTAPDCRGRGLSRWLIEKVLADYAGKVDFIYLFANDSVLDFYPRFGFHRAQEYAAELSGFSPNGLTVQKLDSLLPEHREILYRAARDNAPQYCLTPLHNQSLVMLYCGYSDLNFLADQLYYLPQLDAVAIVSYEGSILTLHEVLSTHHIDLQQLAGALLKPETSKVVLGFIPEEQEGISVLPFQQEDTTLFVQGTDLFERCRLRLPVTAHT